MQAQPWSHDAEAFKRWKEGRTGWPLVDANMVRAEAWWFRIEVTLACLVWRCCVPQLLGAQHACLAQPPLLC